MEIKLNVKYHHTNEEDGKKTISFCDALGNNAITVGESDNHTLFVLIGEGDEEKVAIMSKEDAEKLADFILSVLRKDNQ